MKIVITGTSSGIGQSLAEHLTARGHEVWGLARTASQLRNESPTFHYSSCDVSSWDGLSACATEIKTQWTEVDALICCAAIQAPLGPAMSISPADWMQNINVNLTGTFLTIRAFYDLLVSSTSRAKVLCFSGGGATSQRPNFTPYAVSKTGVVRLVENLSEEWKDISIDINAIAPGAINTRMTQQLIDLGPDVVGQKEFQSATERLSQPTKTEDAPPKYVGLTDFLLSPQSDGISGRLISAPWDPWDTLDARVDELKASDIFTLRRITPKDRNLSW